MKFLGHVLIGILALFLYPWIGYYSIIIAVSSIAVDIDHFQILVKEKAFSFNKIRKLLKEGYKEYSKSPKQAFKGEIFVLHSLEFVIILTIIAYFFYYDLFFVVLGVLLHISTDVIHHLIKGFPVVRWLFFTSNFIRQ